MIDIDEDAFHHGVLLYWKWISIFCQFTIALFIISGAILQKISAFLLSVRLCKEINLHPCLLPVLSTKNTFKKMYSVVVHVITLSLLLLLWLSILFVVAVLVVVLLVLSMFLLFCFVVVFTNFFCSCWCSSCCSCWCCGCSFYSCYPCYRCCYCC